MPSRTALQNAAMRGKADCDLGKQADDNPFDLQRQPDLYSHWHNGWRWRRVSNMGKEKEKE